MLAGLILLWPGDPSGRPPTEAERAFEVRISGALAREDREALASLLREGRDLLPALLDRWTLAALIPELEDPALLERIGWVASAGEIDPPPPLRIPPLRKPEWRAALERLRAAEEIGSLRSLLPVFESFGDARRATLVRLELGRRLAAVQEGAEARTLLRAARRSADETNDAPLLARALETEAQALRDLQEDEEAIETSRRALPIHRRLGDRRGEAEVERGIAVARGRLAVRLARSDPEGARSGWREAEEGFSRAAEIHRSIGEEVLLARALRGRAGVRGYLGDLEGSRRDFEAALGVFERRGETVEAAAIRSSLYSALKKTSPEEALRYLAPAAETLAKEGAADVRAAQAFRLYAEALEERADAEDAPPPDAMRFVRLARAIDEKRGKPDALAQDLHIEARLLYRAGDLEAAEREARRALELQRQDADPGGRSGDILLTLGAVALRGGRFQQARAFLEEALREARRTGDPDVLGPVLARLGHVLTVVGERAAARECLREAVGLEPESLRAQLDALLEYALVESDEGNPEEAVRLLESAAERARAGNLPALEGRVLAQRAALESRRRPESARALLRQARRAFGDDPGPVIRAYLEWIEGEASLASSDYEASVAAFRRAVEATGGTADSTIRAASLAGRVEACLRRGDAREAAEAYREAVRTFASMRPPTLEESWRIVLQERFAELPPLGVEAYVRLGDDASALAATEDAQGRALAEALEGRARPKGATLDALRALLPADGAFVSYAQGLDRLYAFVVRRESLRRVDLGETARVEPLAAAFRRRCAEPSPPSSEAVRAFAEAGERLRDAAWGPLAGALAGCRSVTIAPSDLLAGVPFEALPLEAPPGATSFGELSYAVERHSFSYVPSARVLVALAAVPGKRGTGLLAVGDPAYGGGEGLDGGTRGVAGLASRPASAGGGEGRDLEDLPFSRLEVTAVADLFPEPERTMRLGTGAGPAALAPDGPFVKARHVLLSTHGRADERNRSACGLWLSPATPGEAASFFPASALASREMLADLVVLSACSTNRGRLSEGEGVLSLAREFLRAGCRAVVASEWLVEDAATASLSIAFHEGILRDGLGPAEALRRAKVRYLREERPAAALALRGSPAPTARGALDRRHPFFWAPLLLFGPDR
jgi:CHAT domain-containing protein/tetratricopeptide (TPR) repeat protein